MKHGHTTGRKREKPGANAWYWESPEAHEALTKIDAEWAEKQLASQQQEEAA